MSSRNNPVIKEEAVIASKIVFLRDERVILDFHLAQLYEVRTSALKQAVRRNRNRFPEDFMFELTENEIDMVVSQNVIPSKKYFGGAVPFAFNGVAMLSSVLNSKKAIETNIVIMRTFTLLRKLLLVHKDVMVEIDKIKETIEKQDQNIQVIFKYLKQLEQGRQQELDQINRKRIGFKRNNEQ